MIREGPGLGEGVGRQVNGVVIPSRGAGGGGGGGTLQTEASVRPENR